MEHLARTQGLSNFIERTPELANVVLDSLSCLRGAEAGQYEAQGKTACWHLPTLGHPTTSVCWAWLPFTLLFAKIWDKLEKG